MKLQEMPVWAHALAALLLTACPAITVATRTGRAGSKAALQNVVSELVAEASRTGAAALPAGDADSNGTAIATSNDTEDVMKLVSHGEAGVLDDVQQSSDAALVYIHNRLATASREEAHLRDQLSQALRREQDLSQKLADNQRAEKVMEQRVRKVLARKTRKDAAVLAVERRHEQTLGKRLRNVSRALALRGQALESTRKSLAEMQRERDSVRSALSVAENKSATLTGRLAVASGNLAELQQELAWSKQGFETAKRSWQQREAELKRAEAAEEAEVGKREKALRQEHKKTRELEQANQVKTAELSDLERENAKAAATARAQLSKEHAREDQIQDVMVKERKANERRIKLLTEALKLHEKRLAEESAREGKMKQQLASLQNGERMEVANFTSRVKAEGARVHGLLRENSALHEELKANATLVAHLRAEVALLRHRVEDGNRAREQAEGSARKAKESMEHAQAVAKQLAGTVPRLLEQARLAHEARDAEAALRTQAQASAQRQVQQLQRQYASVVQGELEQINFALPSLGGNASDASKPLTAQMDDPTGNLEQAAAAESLPLADDQEVIGEVVDKPDDSSTTPSVAPAEVEDAPARPPDLSRDSQGLGSLLTEDDSSSIEAVPSS
mmetsp:Transcript_149980/g.417918  ORF Transcript_149980/g.417918 Transcript_149980/m.417918 type:complete len:623 (+) Transcript_149980:62-1930(+)